VTPELAEKVRAALEAWLKGDVCVLESILDEDVELLWWMPGNECRGRHAVVSLLKNRTGQSLGDMELLDAGDDALVVARAPVDGDRPATLITFRDGKIVKMHQFRTQEEALHAAPFRARP
jgi:ketosteroid isomerase-like protein